MAKLRTAEHKRAKPRTFRKRNISQSQLTMRNRGRQGTNSTLRYSRELLNSSVNYISRNKLYTFLAVGLITAGSIYLSKRRANSNLSLLNRWLDKL